MATAFRPPGIGFVNVGTRTPPPPLPKRPEEPEPQHITEPLSISAQVKSNPASTATAGRGNGTVWVGEVLCDVVLSPSCPLLFRPQQTMLPSSRTAQVCSPPAVMSMAVRPEPKVLVATGELLSFELPIPRRP